MSSPVFVGSGFVAQYPEGGGNFWVPLQYLLGLRHEGVDAYWLELLEGSGDPARDAGRLARFRAAISSFGIADRVVVLYMADGQQGGREELHCRAGLPEREVRALMRDGVLLNLANAIPFSVRRNFARTALYDIDPGMHQLWATQWGMGVGEHDLHFTIGQSIGRPGCAVPTLGVEWHRVWPTVYLPAWPAQAAPGARYTTITQWWNGNSKYDSIDGEFYDHNKRTSFLEYVEVPRASGLELELAANITPDETEDRELLARNGWRLIHPHDVAGGPEAYRRYIQSSRGEFSCAKPSVAKTSPGWISDRTICYLASGRPCVVQAAGAERHLPQTLGAQFFCDRTEAITALRAVERDYPRACTDARRLAEEIFATSAVLPRVLDIIGVARHAPTGG